MGYKRQYSSYIIEDMKQPPLLDSSLLGTSWTGINLSMSSLAMVTELLWGGKDLRPLSQVVMKYNGVLLPATWSWQLEYIHCYSLKSSSHGRGTVIARFAWWLLHVIQFWVRSNTNCLSPPVVCLNAPICLGSLQVCSICASMRVLWGIRPASIDCMSLTGAFFCPKETHKTPQSSQRQSSPWTPWLSWLARIHCVMNCVVMARDHQMVLVELSRESQPGQAFNSPTRTRS